MMKGKSKLNPNASPYIPVWKQSTAISLEDSNTELADSEHKASEGSAEYKLPDTFLDYDIPNFDKLRISGESSSNPSQQFYSEDTFDDDLVEFEEESRMADSNMRLKSLSSMFPNVAVDCLAELLNANKGDLSETINVLQQLEYGESDDGAEYPIETTNASTISEPASMKVTSSWS